MSIKFVTEIVFTFIYVYIHLYTFIYIYIRLYTFIYVYIHLYTFIYIYILFGNYQAFEIPAVARYKPNSAGGRATAALINCSLRNS